MAFVGRAARGIFYARTRTLAPCSRRIRERKARLTNASRGGLSGAIYNTRENGRATLIVVATTIASIYHRANSRAPRVRAMCIFHFVPSASRLDARLRGRRVGIHKLHECASKQDQRMRSLLMRLRPWGAAVRVRPPPQEKNLEMF